MSERILDHIGLDGCQSLLELSEANLRVAVQVNPSHYRSQFLLNGQVAHSFEESSHVTFIDHPMVQIIYRLEGSPDAETLKLFQVWFKLFKSQLKVDLHDQEEG